MRTPPLPRWAAFLVLLAAALSLLALPRLRIDNRLERWLGTDADETERYRRFRATFGSDELVIIALGGRPLFDPEALVLMVRCLESLEAIAEVERVEGLPVIYRDLTSGDPEALARELRATPFYSDLVISRDGEVGGIVLTVTPDAGPDGRRRLMARIRTALRPLADAGFDLALVGSTALIVSLDELSAREARRSFPVALGCSLLLLTVLLRSWRGMLVAAGCAALAVMLAMALICGLRSRRYGSARIHTPKGLHPTAQGKRSATLGNGHTIPKP